MSWAIGWDSRWNRHVGYGVPTICDQPGCEMEINRGLFYVCGGEPYGGDEGCGLYFCGQHLGLDTETLLCDRCADGRPPHEPTDDTREWLEHVLTDDSWQPWREENPKRVEVARAALDGAR